MNAEGEVLVTERRRAAAVVARDTAALETCLDATLVYVHATGTVHDRVQLLEYVRSGPHFLEVRLEPRSVRMQGEVALVFGDLHLQLRRTGEPVVQAHSLVTQAWVRRGPQWRLASFQSTRPP